MATLDDLDIAEIRAFAAVARARSFRGATEALDVAQSSISQRIGRLEQKLRRPLLSRTTRSVALTEAGRTFLIYADAILGIAETARRHFDEPPLRGLLRLGIAEDYATSNLPAVLASFKRHYPRFGFTLSTGLSTRLFQGLDDGKFDVVLSKRLPGRAKGALLFRDALEFVGDAHLAEGDGVVPLAIYPEPSETRQSALRTLRDADRTWSVVLESESLAGIRAAAASGLALAVLTRRFIPKDLQAVVVEGGLPAIGDLEYVIDQKAEPRTPALDVFVDLIGAAAKGFRHQQHTRRLTCSYSNTNSVSSDRYRRSSRMWGRPFSMSASLAKSGFSRGATMVLSHLLYLFLEDGSLRRCRAASPGSPFRSDAVADYAGIKQRVAQVLIER